MFHVGQWHRHLRLHLQQNVERGPVSSGGAFGIVAFASPWPAADIGRIVVFHVESLLDVP